MFMARVMRSVLVKQIGSMVEFKNKISNLVDGDVSDLSVDALKWNLFMFNKVTKSVVLNLGNSIEYTGETFGIKLLFDLDNAGILTTEDIENIKAITSCGKYLFALTQPDDFYVHFAKSIYPNMDYVIELFQRILVESEDVLQEIPKLEVFGKVE